MQLDGETLRFIFGFKLRELRQAKDLSLKSLAQMTGLSPSYINEIEKGKKYPKGEKILLLARALGVSYDELTSIQLKKDLSALGQLLGSNLVKGIPFDVFGIPARTVFELIADRPQNFSTLIGTVLDLARNFNIKVEDFLEATLRSYLDAHGNHFPEIEKKAAQFRKEIPDSQSGIQTKTLKELLERRFGYSIESRDFGEFDSSLKELSFVKTSGRGPKLLTHSALSEKELNFILARELGYCHLGLKDRQLSNLPGQADSFALLFNGSQAAYFASAILIPRDDFISKAQDFFQSPAWDPEKFISWVSSYPLPPSAFFHRFSQLVPAHFGLEEMFFLRFDYDPSQSKFRMLKELHLSGLHAPHDTKDAEHYCRRWVSTSLLKASSPSGGQIHPGVQRSRFHDRNQEYLCLSLAYEKELHPGLAEGVTIGLRVNELLKKKIKFLEDPTILRKLVGESCERCGVPECEVRAAPAIVREEQAGLEKMEQSLERLKAEVNASR